MRAILNPNIKEGITFDFEEEGIKHENINSGHFNINEDSDMKHFLKDIETLNLPEIKNQPEIEKIKKRIEAFAKQYGQKTEKTTSIFMNYLETVRQTGVNYLKNNELVKAASYFAECLRFVDPKYDEIFYEKFLIVKIDAINKLMYCTFEIQSFRNRQKITDSRRQTKKFDRYINSERILNKFLEEVLEFHKIQSLKKSQNCLLEINYFYLGRLRRKNNNKPKAIEAFKQALELISNKFNLKVSAKHEETKSFLLNLRAKIYYKLSKCYREMKNNEMQMKFQALALNQAHQIGNLKLQYYLRRKIQSYESKQKFLQRLNKLQGKRRIEEEVIRLIDQSRQTEIKSLYSIYNYQQPFPK